MIPVTSVLRIMARATWSAVAAMAILCLASPAFAQPIESAPEQAIKAAYLCNFAVYVEWPAEISMNSRLTIGVLGDDSLADELERITSGRVVHGRPLEARRVDAGDSLAGLHVLFIAAEETDQVVELIEEAQARSILVVTESSDALALGSVINFRLVDQRVRFEVSLVAADKSRLTISSRLLSVAEHVEPRTGG